MAEHELPPYRCTYCLQALPEDYDQHLLGSLSLRPDTDDAHNFVVETQTILCYALAAANMLPPAEQESRETQSQLQLLVAELIEEALRRLARVQDAVAILECRAEHAQQARPTRPEKGA